jgi:hypothetical protein
MVTVYQAIETGRSYPSCSRGPWITRTDTAQGTFSEPLNNNRIHLGRTGVRLLKPLIGHTICSQSLRRSFGHLFKRRLGLPGTVQATVRPKLASKTRYQSSAASGKLRAATASCSDSSRWLPVMGTGRLGWRRIQA